MILFYRGDFFTSSGLKKINCPNIEKADMDMHVKNFMTKKFGKKLLKKLSFVQFEDFRTAMYTLLFSHRHAMVEDDLFLRQTNEYLSSNG